MYSLARPWICQYAYHLAVIRVMTSRRRANNIFLVIFSAARSRGCRVYTARRRLHEFTFSEGDGSIIIGALMLVKLRICEHAVLPLYWKSCAMLGRLDGLCGREILNQSKDEFRASKVFRNYYIIFIIKVFMHGGRLTNKAKPDRQTSAREYRM